MQIGKYSRSVLARLYAPPTWTGVGAMSINGFLAFAPFGCMASQFTASEPARSPWRYRCTDDRSSGDIRQQSRGMDGA